VVVVGSVVGWRGRVVMGWDDDEEEGCKTTTTKRRRGRRRGNKSEIRKRRGKKGASAMAGLNFYRDTK
jgi:hypothetical protein